MAFQAYRVRKPFQWGVWRFAPKNTAAGTCGCECPTPQELRGGCCTQQTGTGCRCGQTACGCNCGIPVEVYVGDIWLIEESHDRKDMMLAQRFATYDASIPPVETLLKEDYYRRQVDPELLQAEQARQRDGQAKQRQRSLAGAASGGR